MINKPPPPDDALVCFGSSSFRGGVDGFVESAWFGGQFQDAKDLQFPDSYIQAGLKSGRRG